MARMTDTERDALIAEAKSNFDAKLEALANSPAEWLEFIESVASFGARYSVRNQIWLLQQAAEREVDPQYFQPYGTYAKVPGDPKARDLTKPLSGWVKAGRHVIKGETAFYVLAPCPLRYTATEAAAHNANPRVKRKVKAGDVKLTVFRLSPTFELSQTEPIEEGGPEFVVPTVETRRRVRQLGGTRPTLLEGTDPTGAFDDVVKLIKDEGYSFELIAPKTQHLSGGANGVTVRGPSMALVQVRNDVSDAQRVKTTVHELAHILCGHLDGATTSTHRGQNETEAESVAHIVCKALGLDTEAYSAPYVAGWADGDMKLVAASANTIVRVAKQILTALDPTEEETA